MLHGPHLSTNVPLLPLTGMPRLEPKITKQYLKSSKPQSKTPQPYTFLITLSPGSSALTPPTMLLVLSFSNSTPAPPAILLWRCNQLGYLQARGLCALLRALTLTDTRNNVRQAIAATYQGYCSELFVLGLFPRKQIGCPFDHSAPALKRCIRSFTLLIKRELDLYGQLPPWSQNTKDTTHTRATSTSNQPDGPPTFNRTRDQHTLARNPGSLPQSRTYNK